MRKKVYVGLSGGVDSAVSAALLQKAGYDVTGVFIRIAIEGYPCPAAQDRVEAMRVAAHLRIPFREIDLSKEYTERVFAQVLGEYGAGRTPNPDTLCNREIKFGIFYDWAMRHGADSIATGHYARTKGGELFVGVDSTKDQSYFLCMVPQNHLEQVLFPVGDKKKSEVRDLAERFGLPNAKRKDSQGLCFLGDISLTDMLTHELHPSPGDVLDTTGEVIGRHDGAQVYTLGQRHGFTITARAQQRRPHYVVAKDIAHNTITVSEEQFPSEAHRVRIALTDTNWIGAVQSGEYQARFRYRQPLIAATLTTEPASVILHTPHYVPEGQVLVLYDGERCLGGGVITEAVFC